MLERMIGLLRDTIVPPRTGMWLDECAMVHTLFMRATIDIVFVDGDGCVRRVVPAVRPNAFAIGNAGAYATVELGAGTIEGAKIRVGDHLDLEPID